MKYYYWKIKTARSAVVTFDPNFGHNSASDRAKESLKSSLKADFKNIE